MAGSRPQHLYAKLVDENKLKDCIVSCMIQIRNHIIIGDNQSKQPAVKLFGSKSHLLHEIPIPKSSIKDMTRVGNNTFAVLREAPRYLWLWFSECNIDLLEITADEKLKEKHNYKFGFQITAFCYANDSYFIACIENSKTCIKVYKSLEGESVMLQTTGQNFGKKLTKIHVDKSYRMTISDNRGQLHVVKCDPITQNVTNIKCHKFTVLHIEQLPHGTILLATAGNTSIVRLLPDAESTDNNFKETSNYPCGMGYNKETNELRVAVKIRNRLFWSWLKIENSYKILTYKLCYRSNTDTVINM